MWSLYNHHANANAKFYEFDLRHSRPRGSAARSPAGGHPSVLARPVRRDGLPFWSLWENMRSWWAIRDLPNVLFVHYNSLKPDMPGQMRRIAVFLNIPIDESRWRAIVEYCSFDWMKQSAEKSAPLGGIAWEGGADTFIHKGVNGRWKDILKAEDCAEYEARAIRELGQNG